jgi:beta-lactam-binding protein with PASTA domain
MLQVEGGPERNFKPRDTQSINVLVAASQTAAAGQRNFYLTAVDVEAPDDNFEDSQSVSFSYAKGTPTKFPWWIVIAAAVLIAAGVGGWYIFSGGGITIADYTGQKFDDVSTQLKSDGLQVQKGDEINDPTKPAGIITTQSLAKGAQAKKGDVIAFVVTAQTLKVPRVKGETIDEAKSTLSNAGFVIDKAVKTVNQTTNDSGGVGRVTSQTPDPDSNANAAEPASGPITLTVGVAPDQASVPNLLGHARCDATSTLSKAGFNPSVQYNAFAPGANDTVVTQAPPAGNAPKGSTVALVITDNSHPLCYIFIGPIVMQQLQVAKPATVKGTLPK